jgi:hypothetical protein
VIGVDAAPPGVKRCDVRREQRAGHNQDAVPIDGEGIAIGQRDGEDFCLGDKIHVDSSMRKNFRGDYTTLFVPSACHVPNHAIIGSHDL